MKVAVIGGGTAGYMAAAMLTHRFPDLELCHIYDPSIPTIGVGEGTLVSFPPWLHEVTRLSEEQIRHRCGITRKYGITFENWGPAHDAFVHHFSPAKVAYGYHISAPGIVELLNEYVSATRIEKQVDRVDSDGHQVAIQFRDGTSLVVGFAFDARGFPSMTEEDVLPLSIIPTNAARIRTGPPVPGQTTTRSVARPHGWIFIIPLTMRTAYGYIYNHAVSSPEDVDADLLEFLAAEHVQPFTTARDLRFPNFARQRFFDGALFRIGNRASFLEPLEATAIGVISSQLEAARLWVLGEWSYLPLSDEVRARNIDTLNRYLFRYVLQIALFVGWHYSTGSAFQSPFWDYAVNNFRFHAEHFVEPALVTAFNDHIRRASRFDSLSQYWCRRADSGTTKLFGCWPLESFVEMYNGLEAVS